MKRQSERPESPRRGSERCGIRTIGTSSSQSQANPGRGGDLRDPFTPAAASAYCLPLALASPNLTTPESTWKLPSAWACPLTPPELALTVRMSPRCVNLRAPHASPANWDSNSQLTQHLFFQ